PGISGALFLARWVSVPEFGWVDKNPRLTYLSLLTLAESITMTEKDILKEKRPRMDTVIEDFRRKLATVRTGRAAVSLLDTIMVVYYGTMTPLNQMASVHAPEPQMLTVQPWDQTQLGAVEKAIR